MSSAAAARDAAEPLPVGPWLCPNCRRETTTPFCPHCGERPIRIEDLTVGGALARIAHAATSVDGRVLRTFRRLLLHPGTLTRSYVEGQRKPYATPFAVFLIANVLFFAVQSLTHTSVLGSTLDRTGRRSRRRCSTGTCRRPASRSRPMRRSSTAPSSSTPSRSSS